jgi:hypothetical protein
MDPATQSPTRQVSPLQGLSKASSVAVWVATVGSKLTRCIPPRIGWPRDGQSVAASYRCVEPVRNSGADRHRVEAHSPIGQATSTGYPSGGRRAARGMAAARISLNLLVISLTLIGATACGMGVDQGDCVVQNGGVSGLLTVECSEDRALRVLEVRADDAKCHDVPGVTESYAEEHGSLYCLGPPDADPGKAINTAQVGDCAARYGSNKPLKRMDCSNPDADFRILRRVAEVTPSGHECDAVTGTTSRYEWALKPSGFARDTSPDGVVFCLAALDAGSR